MLPQTLTELVKEYTERYYRIVNHTMQSNTASVKETIETQLELERVATLITGLKYTMSKRS